jgi:hypothetical protein
MVGLNKSPSFADLLLQGLSVIAWQLLWGQQLPCAGGSMRAQTIGPQSAVQFMTLMDRKDDRPEIVVSLIGEPALLSDADPTDQNSYEVPGRL